ncbi:MAG: RagB/SusD family nutrient uptake outer membrane protein [Tenacibaculum sp.]|nr:RagB/SusD family nutrient uptake outer membrane protein [Tenacibaculum sp.]
MKNSIKAIALSTVLLFTSCNDYLEVEPDRRTQLDSKDKIQKILVSAYSRSSFAVLTELSSDNIDDLGDKVHWDNDDYNMFYWKNVDGKGKDTPENLWSGMYEAIANANAALDAIEKSSSKEELKPQKGEALITRAYAHFVLVNVFGKHYNEQTSKTDLGVVYMEEAEKTLSPKYKRESVADIYVKIEKDLLEGLPLINNSMFSEETLKYHFNTQAANAFAARFYLYYGKWKKAEHYANLVLGQNPKSLLKNWKELNSGAYEQYDDIPKEYVSSKRPANLLVQEMSSIRSRKFYWGGKKFLRFKHHELVSKTETIKANSFYGPGNRGFYMGIFSSIAPYNITTFFTIPEFFKITDPINNIGYPYTGEVLFTTDETLLVRAEARAMQKKYDLSANDLNMWVFNFHKYPVNVTVGVINDFYNKLEYYTNENPTQKKKLNPKFVVEPGTQENLIHAVLQCRRVLTLHEGLRWFDVKRYGIEIPRRLLKVNGTVIDKINDNLTVDDPRRAIQLPKNVISSGLQANPR